MGIFSKRELETVKNWVACWAAHQEARWASCRSSVLRTRDTPDSRHVSATMARAGTARGLPRSKGRSLAGRAVVRGADWRVYNRCCLDRREHSGCCLLRRTAQQPGNEYCARLAYLLSSRCYLLKMPVSVLAPGDLVWADRIVSEFQVVVAAPQTCGSAGHEGRICCVSRRACGRGEPIAGGALPPDLRWDHRRAWPCPK